MDYNRLADLIFPHIADTVEDLFARYPRRDLPKGACVTRFAPSPTGFMHIGGLYAAMISRRIAKQSEGVFYLRIEDTDKKRELEGGVTEIISALKDFGIVFDEGPTDEVNEAGAYGPYKQSHRKDLYQTVAKDMMRRGLAYPCFCTADDLDAIRKEQEASKEANVGYWGRYAKCRDLSLEEIEANLAEGKEFVVRLRSPGSEDRRIVCKDMVRGNIEFPENVMDVVLLKSDGIPTYHFAHVVDDTLMGTTHVIRGDEWLSSYPVHEQLFAAAGFPLPGYIHIAPIMKLDGSSKRKLSKRKDPEAAVSYYHQEGYCPDAVLEYLMTIANSSYEEWRIAHPEAPTTDYKLKLDKMPAAGALFDMDKLADVSKDVVAGKSQEDCFAEISAWAERYSPDLAAFIKERPENFMATIALWKFSGKKVRKDIAKWSDLMTMFGYMYQGNYTPAEYEFDEKLTPALVSEFLTAYMPAYDPNRDSSEWFSHVGEVAAGLGYCPNMKEYKKDPTAWKGSIADACAIIRVAVTGKKNSPDLHTILSILGKEEALRRMQACLDSTK